MENHTRDPEAGAPVQTVAAMDDYVFVSRPVGYVLDSESIKVSTAQITSACRDAGVDGVLIFGPRTYIRATEGELTELADTYAKVGLRIAIVESHNAKPETTSFFRQAAESRGVPVRFFDKIRDATDWLSA